jgi:acetate kinase
VSTDRQSDESILVLNVGSSTLKFGVFPLSGSDSSLLDGALDHSRQRAGRLRITHADGRSETSDVTDPSSSPLAELLTALERNPVIASVVAVGHRLVHGGTELREPVRVDAGVREALENLVPLAPDHLPAELSAIDEIARLRPDLVQIGCFDTAFHSTLPAVARILALPRELADSGVVRYGFHGLSYEYITTTLRERGELAPRTVIAHLGNGASIAAISHGVCIDTSMGMTPAGGLVMSTRSGDLDPGVLLYLSRARAFSLADLDNAVNRHGGLLGISQTSADVRDLLAARSVSSKARDAIDIFCYQVRKFIGAYSAALGGLDLLVFTGGIGEHSADIRAQICEGLGFLGIRIDSMLNSSHAPVISAAAGGATVRVIKTREEAMIARHVRELLAQSTVSPELI